MEAQFSPPLWTPWNARRAGVSAQDMDRLMAKRLLPSQASDARVVLDGKRGAYPRPLQKSISCPHLTSGPLGLQQEAYQYTRPLS